MDLNQLRTFRYVATTLSFTQAAQLLNYAQSSVSAQIRSLEEELRSPLFQRLGRRIALTEAGKRMLAYSERMLSLEEEARAALTGETSYEDVIRLGAPETLMTYRLPPVLRQFRQLFPKIRLTYGPMVDIELYRGVMGGKLDFALLLQPPVRSENLKVEPLLEERLQVIAPTDHPLAGRTQVRPEDLAGETVFVTESGCGYRHLFEQELAKNGNYSCAKLEFSSIEAIKRCVAAGLGLGFLPDIAIKPELERGEIAALDWEKPFIVQTQLVWHPKKWISPAEAKFVELCRGMGTGGGGAEFSYL